MQPIIEIFNPSSGGSASGTTIPQLSSDPSSPAAQTAWVLRTGSGGSGGGKPIGLLLSLTQPNTGGSFTYQLSYRTIEGTTKRVTLA